MFKTFIILTMWIGTLSSSLIFADCCQSADVSIGWRRDSLHWKTDRLRSSYAHARANSHILYRKMDAYTLSANLKWVDSEYYIRFSAEYGLTDKGRARERFRIKSPWLYDSMGIQTDDPVKLRSEVYDFNLAVGYPLTFFCCRLSVVPLIGFSYHRQHLRVKGDRESLPYQSSAKSYSESYFYISSLTSNDLFDFTSISEHSSFSVESSNPFRFSPSSDPFSSPEELNIANALGLSNRHRTSSYRFTWYGFYLGTDIAYALDSCWTLFSELEVHFLDNCHRKRKSWTGVYFVDDYHHKGWAYGFNGVLGCTYAFATCWYTTVSVNFNWWKAHSEHDELHWKTVGAKIGVGYMF